MLKGIRVNQLAKELGIESKSILARLRDVGMDHRVPNHMSVLSVELADAVRDWFGGGGSKAPPPAKAAPEVPKLVQRPAAQQLRISDNDYQSPESEADASYGDGPRDLRMRVLRDLERLMGRVYNGNIQNYGPGGVWEGEGRLFSYHATHTTQTGRHIKAGTAESRKAIDRHINGRHPTESVLMSGTYHFGANLLPVYRNLDAVLRYLEQHFGLRLDGSQTVE